VFNSESQRVACCATMSMLMVSVERMFGAREEVVSQVVVETVDERCLCM
jgi:hypothetical protein